MWARKPFPEEVEARERAEAQAEAQAEANKRAAIKIED